MRSGLLFFLLCLMAGTVCAQTFNWDASFANNGQLTLAPTEMENNDYESGDGLIKLADGKLLLSVNNTRSYLRRLLPNGQPDSSFANKSISAEYPIRQGKMVMLANGNILLIGIENINPSKQIKVFRLLPDGSPDLTFHVNGTASIDVPYALSNSSIQDLVLQPDGKVLVYLATPKNTSPKEVVQVLRIDTDGNADKSFAINGWYRVPGDGNTIPAGIAISGKRVIVAYHNYDRVNEYTLQGLDTNGQPDLAFGNQGKVVLPNLLDHRASWICSLPDGRILAGGGTNYSGTYFLHRLYPNGRIDSSFGIHGQASLYNLGMVYSGKCIIADNSNGVRVVTVQNSPALILQVSRVDSTGKQDLAFGNLGKASLGMQGTFPQPGNMLMLADGSMYLTGTFFNKTNRDYFIARLNPEGQVDKSLGETGILGGYLPSARASFTFLRSDRNGNIYTKYIPSQTPNAGGFIKIKPSGLIDSTFGLNGIASSEHYYFDTLSDGKLISAFHKYNPNNPNYSTLLSKLTAKGLPDSSFGTNGTLPLNIKQGFFAWQVQTVKGDKLAILGSYPKAGQISTTYAIAWFQSNGLPDVAMGNQGITELPFIPYLHIQLMTPLSNGSLVLGGFSGEANKEKYTLARLLPDGKMDTGFGVNGIITDSSPDRTFPSAILPQPNGDFVVAYFRTNSTPQASLARFTSAGKWHPDFKSPDPMPQKIASYLTNESGKIVILSSPQPDAANQATIYRYQPNGLPDTAYGNNGKSTLQLQPGTLFQNGLVVGNKMYFAGQQISGLVTKALLTSVTNAVPLPVVSSFTLVNATTDKDLQPLSPSTIFNIASIKGRSINIRANVSDTTIKSVVMELSGKQTHRQVESIPAYALFGNTGNDYGNWTPAPGNYTLTATPYTGTKGMGTAGTPLTVSFTITDELTLSSLDLVNARTNTRIGALANGATIDLAQTPDINIVAMPGKGLTQSVVFGLNNKANFKLENAAPYALASDNKGDYSRWNIKPGTYTITATPYPETRARGKAGEAKTITITIINGAVKSAFAANSHAPVLDEGAGLKAGVYPNPTTGAATLNFALPEGSFASIDLLDAGGARVQKVFNGKTTGGIQQLSLHMEGLKAGLYFVRIQTTAGRWQVMKVVKQ